MRFTAKVEATFTYERTSMLSHVTLANTGTLRVDQTLTVPVPATLALDSNLADTLGVRLGGDYNLLPGVLAVRAGASYETGGASATAAQIHLPAYAGASAHLGISARWRVLTVSAGYGHFFFAGNDAPAAVRSIIVPGPQIDPNHCPPTLGPAACTINRGSYTAHFDVLSVTLAARF